MMAVRSRVIIAVFCAIFPTMVDAACRQALALAVDISGSVSTDEHRFQRNGLAAALLDDQVSSAFLSDPGHPVRVMVFEWAGPKGQAVIVPWTDIQRYSDLEFVASELRKRPRGNSGARTATGQAMLFAAEALAQQVDCERWTLDMATDGLANSGVEPTDARESDAMDNITVNGLAIGSGQATGEYRSLDALARIVAFLGSEVIHGPDAFIEIAETFEAFPSAIKKKLLKELSVRAFSQITVPGHISTQDG